jgi:hypothetical protein
MCSLLAWAKLGIELCVSLVLQSCSARANDCVVFYAVKTRMQVTIQTLEMVDPRAHLNTRRDMAQQNAFRPFGQGVAVPKDVHSLTTLSKSVAIAGEKGMLVVDPTQ